MVVLYWNRIENLKIYSKIRGNHISKEKMGYLIKGPGTEIGSTLYT